MELGTELARYSTVTCVHCIQWQKEEWMEDGWRFVEVLGIGLALLVRVDGSRLSTLAVMDRRCTPKLGRSTVTSIE